MKPPRLSYCYAILLSTLFFLTLLALPCFAQEKSVAELVVNRFLQTRGQVSERDLLLLMTQPKEFLKYQQILKATAPELEQKALAIRLKVFQRALERVRAEASQEGGGIIQAVIALGSWADLLNPNAGDMDVIVKGGKGAARRFNQFLHEEIEKILAEEGDDVCREVFKSGARFTVETFEIYVSTLEDFGYDSLKSAYHEALAIATKDGQAAGAAHLRNAADSIIQRNLNAQRFAAVQKEYYPGVSGQDFVRDYFNKKGKSRTWRVDDNGAPDSKWAEGMTAEQLEEAMIKDLGLSVGQASGMFKFPVIADELLQWGERAKLGPREQAKGLVRAYDAKPAGYGLLTEEEANILETARIIATAERENQAYIRQVLSDHRFASAQAFSEAGEKMLWNLTKASNNEAMKLIVENQKAAVEAVKAGKEVEAEFRRIKDYLMSNEQLAGYSKLKPEHLIKLSEELPEKMAFREEMVALLEFMAEGSEIGARSAANMAKRLVKLAFQQKRLSAEATGEAIKAIRAGKGLPAEVEEVIAVLRRDLSDLASIRAVSPAGDSLADCIRTTSIFSKGGMTLTPELEAMVGELSKLSEIELLQLGFKNSEIALLAELNAARAQGARLAVIGEALKKTAPKNYRAILKGFVLEAKKAAPTALAFQGAFALWSVYNVVTDASIPEEEQRKRLGEAIYTAFPTAGLVLDGLPMAYIAYTEGGEIDSAALGQGVAFAGLEILGLVNPVAAVGVLAVYATGAVTVGAIQADWDRQFITALYNSLDGNTLKVQDGTRSFDTTGLMVLTDPNTKLPLVIHSPAFTDLYTPRGDVLLDTGEGRRPYTWKVNYAVRDFAKRYVWAGNERLKNWEMAVKKNFPNINLDEVESWKLGELTEQAADVTGNQFKVGARLVRRYLNERDLLVESTLRTVRGRLFDMQTALNTVSTSKKELEEIENILTMEKKIIPNAQAEQDSFLGFMWDTMTSSQTHMEQMTAVWRRYLKTYKETVTVYGRVTKVFESVDLTAPTGADLFGLEGVEAKDKPKTDTVFQSFQTTYDKAFQEFRGAKGGQPDPKDAFDADAWKQLLSLRMRLFIAEFQKTTPARIAGLEKDVADVIEAIKNHYNLAIDLTVTGPTQSEVEKDVRIEAVAKARTKGGEANLKQTRIEWYMNGKYYNTGNSLWFSPIQEGTFNITAYVVTEMRGKRESIVSRDHTLTVVAKKKEDTGKTDDSKLSDPSKQDATKQPPTCSFEYTDWGECVRATKKQTRSVKATNPVGCVEKQKPDVERGCNPPPTEEDKRNSYLNCLCRCSSGWAGDIGVWYDPEGKSIPECKSNGPCFGGAGAWGCTSRHFFIGPNDCGKGCWESAFGNGTWDPDKADKLRKEENKKYKKPLTVKITPSKNPADFGDIIDLRAEASEGSGGYAYNWGGCAQDAKEYNAKVPNTRDCKACTASVTVTDLDGDSASASVTIQCNTVKVKLTKESPKENTVPVGGSAKLYAEVFSGDKPFSGPTLYYHWEPNPDVVYGDPKNPAYETSAGSQARNSATFRKVGNTPVWVTVLRDMDGRKATIGESQQIPIDVVNPELTIKANPEKPNIGQEVKLEVTTKPAMGDDIIGFWWEIPNYWTGTGDKASFKPKDNKPVKVAVHAKTKDGGDEVGMKELTITAQEYQVAISEPRYLESPPQIWKCDTQLGQAQKCGMVTVKPTEFAVFRDLFMKATITPQADSPRYRWSVDPGGSCGLPGSGSEVKLNCSSTGSYTVKLEVTNADGAKLGEATQSVTVSISNEVLEGSKKAKDAAEKLQKAKSLVAQGGLDEGIALAGEAASLDPKNAEAKSLGDKWKNERTTVQKQLEEFKKFVDAGKLPEAQKEYDGAAKLHGKYKPVVDAGEVLKKKQEEAKQKRLELTKKLEQAQALSKQGKIDEAIAAAEDIAKVDQALAKPVLAEIGLAAKKNGWDALYKGDHQTAIKRLEQAVKLNPTDADATKKLADAKAYAAQMPRAEAKTKEFDGFIAQKKIWSAYKAMLELQDILRPLSAGQSAENPTWKHVNEEMNKGLVWYNDFSQKAMAEWTRLFKEQEWEQAETHLKQVLTVELSPADKKQYDSSLQTVNYMLGQRRSAMQYYENAKANFAKGLPADSAGLAAAAKELRNQGAVFKQTDPRKRQLEDLAALMEKKQKNINAKAYAQAFFTNGDQYYRAYNFEAAVGQYGEGLKAMKENGDISDPDYGKYYKLREDAAAKDKRFKELYSYAAALAVTEKPLDQDTIKKGITAVEEALKIRPKNGDAEIHWNKLKWKLGELQRASAQKQQAAVACEAKWTDGKALYDAGRFTDGLARFKENLACALGNKDREAYVRQLEDSLKKKEAAKQACTALRQQGDGLAQQKRYPEAIGKYRESLKCQPDPKLEQYIAQIESTMKQAQETETRKAQAKKLRDDAYALQQQNRLKEAIAKYKESLALWPDQQLTEYVRQLETQASKPVQTPVQTTQPVKTPVQTGSSAQSGAVASFSGTWRAATGKQKEELTFVISQTGNRVTGTYSVQVPMQNGGKESFSGRFDGSVTGNRATGSWRDTKEKEGVGTFELVLSSDGNSLSAVLKGGDVTEPYTLTRTRSGASAPVSTQSTGSTSSGARNYSVTADVTNKSSSNTHVFVQGDSFGPSNKFGPGEKRRVQVQTSGNGSVTFVAGRDGKVIAQKTWQGDPGNPNRVPTVVFDESNPYDKLVITTGLR